MTVKNTTSSVLADLWARNNEGVAALIAALEEALTSPAKIAALATIELPVWGRLFDWRWTALNLLTQHHRIPQCVSTSGETFVTFCYPEIGRAHV